LPKEVVSKVVDKFVLQLEAQLADRHVTIELSDEARAWLVERGYDETMGARPMARLIQSAIKMPLAEELLFGRLKEGGAVRVIVRQDETGGTLGFDYLEGPVSPRPEKVVAEAKKTKSSPSKKSSASARKTSSASKAKPVRTVPKVPL
jgi:ATP-dependent Clp protease ATP-binding subunit ClpA